MQNKQDKTTAIFRDAPVPKAVLTNVIPSIVSMIMVLAYNLADTFFIGQTKNAYMVAAISVSTPVFLIFMAIGMLFGIGGTSLISRMLGAGNRDRARTASSFCFWTGLSIGIISMVLILFLAEPICRIAGASEDTIGYAKEYLTIVAIGIPFLIVGNSFSNIIRSEGKAQKAMAGMIIGNMINIVLDPVMILVLGWNVAGAAIATVLGNIFASVFYVIHLLSSKSMLSISPKDYKAGNRIATSVLAIGIPASLNSMLMSISNIIVNNKMKAHGDMAVAGVGVAMKVNMIAVMLLIGLGTGIQPLLGYCFGARNRKRYLAVLKFSVILALCLSFVMSAICYFGAAPLVTAFLDDPDAFDFGFMFSRVYILSGPILGLLFVFINAIQSTGAAIPSLILSVSRQGILFIPIIFTMDKVFHTARTLVLAQPITDYLATALAVILFIITYKKVIKAADMPAPKEE